MTFLTIEITALSLSCYALYGEVRRYAGVKRIRERLAA